MPHSSDSARLLRQLAWLLLVMAGAASGSRVAAQATQPTQADRALASSLTAQAELASYGLSIRHPPNWTLQEGGGIWQLVSVPADRVASLDLQTLEHTPQVFISVDRLRSHAEAVQRLEFIRAEFDAPVTFLTIGDWPALQRRVVTAREQPGALGSQLQPPPRAPRAPPGQEGPVFLQNILRVTTAIAAGNSLVRIEGRLPPDAPSPAEATVRVIGQNVIFRAPGNRAQAQREITQLRGMAPRRPIPPPRSNVRTLRPGRLADRLPAIAVPRRRAATGAASAPPSSLQSAGLAQNVIPGGIASEAEIAVSTNGQNIVIGQAGNHVTSNDGGQNFPFSGPLPGTVNGDASVAFGRSGTFYAATIATNATAFSASAPPSNGRAFTARTNAFTCGTTGPTVCPGGLPDQEHIAADRFNGAVGGGGDQVYSVWRQLNGFYGIVCSNDGGVNWGTPIFRPGDLPRIAVGQDGRVYVVYQTGANIALDRFSACSTPTGFAVQPTASAIPVATIGPNWVRCPVPGLDRCNDGNNLSSFTVAVDDRNANHIYIAYAQNDGTGTTENIVIRDSTNSGEAWPAARVVTVSSAVAARRYMPWVCATGGVAYVSWFDRRASTAANNSLTDFYGGSASLDGGGNLVPGVERQINAVGQADNQCLAGQAAGAPGSWPGGVRNQNDSEACSTQPQLGGRCLSSVGPPAVGSNNSCDFNSTACPTLPLPETCVPLPLGGFPKYGDYNGSACTAGRVYAIWPSATTPPPTIGPAGAINLYFASLVVAASQIQVPGPLVFPDTCVGSSALTTANVCNTGTNPLRVDPITSSDPQFSVSTPSSGYPVTVAAGSCFPFQVRFTPASAGNKSAALTVPSDDTVSPNVTIFVSGRGTQAAMTTMIADAGDFGTVTPGLLRDQPLVITNPGSCPLTVTNLASNGPDFLAAQVTSFPFTVASGAAVNVPIRFQPTGVGPKAATLTISSNDPAGATRQVRVSGTGGAPVITTSVVDTGNFGQVCVGDTKDLNVTVTNSGVAPLVITAIASSSLEFQVPQVLVFPLVVAPGTSLEIPIRLAPTTAGPKTTILTLSSNDPATLAKTVTLTGDTPAAELCHAPSFTSVGLSIGPTFGSTRTGDFTVTAQGW